MKKASIEQIDLFAGIFEEAPVKPVEKPHVGITGKEKEVIPSANCEPTCESDGDSDLPNFADHEQELEGTKTSSTNTTDAVKKKENVKKFEEINQPWIICYAGHKIPFDQPGTTLDQVRKMLEGKYFPELTKERTEMTFDEKKGIIIPVVKGAKKGAVSCNVTDDFLKGYFFSKEDLIKHRKPISILAARDGYYEIQENDIGVFCVKAPYVGELDPCQEGFNMKLPKIPAKILEQIISFFRFYCLNGENEVMAQVFWDKSNQTYFVKIPRQVVGHTVVSAKLDQTIEAELDDSLDPKYVQVLQLHSHNVMEAFWSETDNACEIGTRIYGVIGNLDRFYPTIRTRISVGGKFFEIPVSKVFEAPFTREIPTEWHENVTVVKRGVEQC